MIGGYSVVALVMNTELIWPDRRVVSRQQVEAWHKRRTPNQLSQLPPSAITRNPAPARTSPTWVFETGDWLTWALAGVPGPRRAGWVVPRPGHPDYPPRPRPGTGLLVRPRHRNAAGRWVITHPHRKPVEM
jgi:hypothetical protein